MTLEVQKTGCDVGAEIKGLDLSQPVSADNVALIEDAFNQHQVLVFRDQALNARQFADFSGHFGFLRRHIQKAFRHPTVPEIVYNRNVDEEGNFDEAGAKRGVTETLEEGWHSDVAYENRPVKATSVHALEVPSFGGNTCFVSSYRAYGMLPNSLRVRVAGLRAEFALGRNRRNQQTQKLTEKLAPEDKLQPTVTHPIICRHPVTGRPAIFACPLLTVRIIGLEQAESDDLLETLFGYIHEAGSTGDHWEHKWRIGDTLIWDNRGGLMHSGRLDYPLDQRRIMFRCSIGESVIEAMAA